MRNDAIGTKQGVPDTSADIVCLSHLRWNFVFQRPQHLMSRFAADHRVFFIEEPRFEDGPDRLELTEADSGVRVAVPIIAESRRRDPAQLVQVQRALLERLMHGERIRDYVLWFYTPMAVPLTRNLAPLAVVYDCMDELTGFAGAPAELGALEAELLEWADLVTTGGRSLFEAKRGRHANVHAFPSSIDAAHFAQARTGLPEPPDQAPLARPRIGFAGVIDERMDLGLVEGVARSRPDWQLVMLGPVAKIDPATLPRRPNIHWLGMKQYAELPRYFAGWQVGMLPFAHNAATRYISPTKTPEYLAAGLAVVSTSIRDVVTPYGDLGLCHVADDVPGFVAAIEAALREDAAARQLAADAFLGQGSWAETARRMRALMLQAASLGSAFGEAASGGAP